MIADNIYWCVKQIHPNGEYCYEESEGDTQETFDARFLWISTDLPKPSLAELQAVLPQAIAAKALKTLRDKRDTLLAETDWWASSDRTMTAEQTAYRQALRDLPANTTDPENPVWPVKPE